jgi:hypothetical protein
MKYSSIEFGEMNVAEAITNEEPFMIFRRVKLDLPT